MKKAHTSPLWTRSFILLSLANFLMFTAFYFLIPTLPVYITKELGGNKSMVGIVLAVYTLSALIIRPFTGITIDTFGRKTIYLVALVLFSLVFNAYVFAESIVFLMVLRFMHGLAWGVTTTTGNTIVVDIIPPARRGEGIGIFGLSFTLAMALGPFLGMLIWSKADFHTVFVAAAGLSLLGWVLAMNVRYPAFKPLHGKSVQWKNLFEVKSMPVSLSLILLNITYGGVISFITLYGKEIGVGQPGIFFLVYAAGVAISRFFSGWVFDRKGPAMLIFLGISLMIIGFPILALVQTTAGYLIAAIVLGFGGGVVMPTFQAMVNNMVEPQRRGAANSTLFTALDLGIGGGMVLIGFLSDVMGISNAFLICSVLCLVSLIYYFAFVQTHYLKNKLVNI